MMIDQASGEKTEPLPSSRSSWLIALGAFIFWAAAFGIAFTQWPLFSENQNTKFLQGLAAAGMGTLNEDWLANTLDPLPAFSYLVRLTYTLLPAAVFYLYHVLLLGIYLISVSGIAETEFPILGTRAGRVLFMVPIIALHASLLPPFSWPVMGTSLGWLLQAGVANQYLFNPAFQPSTFGVLLILSIFLFLRDKPYWATLVAALAAVFHSTYLPSAAVLTAAYMLISTQKATRTGEAGWRALRPALLIGGLALAVVTPVLAYNALVFSPTSTEAWARSQDIIVNFRIPHHSLPEIWIDDTVYAKIGIVLLALVLVRKSPLFPIMLLAAVTAVLLTPLHMVTDNDTLAFIAPWRISVFLVPLSSAMIVAWIVQAILKGLGSRVERYEGVLVGAGLLMLALLVIRGASAMQDSFTARQGSDRNAMMAFVRETNAPGQRYLTPTYLAEFRLATGASQLVTFKSHPYKDVEVIEWQERVLAADHFYGTPACEKLDALVDRYGLTHAVLEVGQLEDGCPGYREVYRDERYRVWTVETGPKQVLCPDRSPRGAVFQSPRAAHPR